MSCRVGTRCRCFMLNFPFILGIRQKACRPQRKDPGSLCCCERPAHCGFPFVSVAELSHTRSSPSEYLGNALVTFFPDECPLSCGRPPAASPPSGPSSSRAFWEARMAPPRSSPGDACPGPSRRLLIPPAQPVPRPPPSSVLSPPSWPTPARTLGMTLPLPRLFQGTEVRDSEVRRRPTTRGEASLSPAGTRSRLQQGACGSVRAPLSPAGILNSLQRLLCLVRKHSPQPKCPSLARDVSVSL